MTKQGKQEVERLGRDILTKERESEEGEKGRDA
jgi:hypothetical protein